MTTPQTPGVPRPTVFPLGQLAADATAAHADLAASHGQAADAARGQLAAARETKAQRRRERLAALQARDHDASGPAGS
jgi:hypothetical protein